MDSTGTRLREERETRGMSLDQIAEATGVGLSYLEAMEAGNFEALPGRAFGKLYIRAYAEVLAFDPQPLIDLYDRERRHGGSPDAVRPAPAGSRPVAEAIARWKAARSDVVTEAEVAENLEEPAPEDLDIEALPVVEVEAPPPAPLSPEPTFEERPVEAVVEIPAPAPSSPRPAPIPATSVAEPARSRRALLVGAVVLAAIVIAIAFVIGGGRAPKDTPAPVSAPAKADPPQASPPPVVVNEPPAPSKVTPAPPKVAPVAKPTGPPSDLSITESALGRRVVSGRLEGEGTEFHEGDVVCFQTRVLGGRRGDAIRHVWIYEGRAQQSISLRVNDADWRTHSAKTIYKSGSWSVEARDASGRVLASAAFTCRPR